MATSLLAFFLAAAAAQSEFGPHFRQPTIRPPIQCFTCATPDFQEMWSMVGPTADGTAPISAFLNRPQVFTPDCDTGLKFLRSHPSYALVWCNSSCITITEQTTIGAIPYDNYIRGCASELFKLERTKRLLGAHSLLHLPRPSVHRCGFEITLADLYGGPADHIVDVCSCGWDKCNTWPYDPAEYGEPTPDRLMNFNAAAAAKTRLPLFPLITLLLLA